MTDIRSYNLNRLNELKKDEDFSLFIMRHQFSDAYLLEHINLLYEAFTSKRMCRGCKGLFTCAQQQTGQYLDVSYNDTLLLEAVYCDFRLKEKSEQDFADSFVYSDIAKQYREVTMENYEPLDESSMKLLYSLHEIYTQKRTKGLYIYGDYGVGKTYACIALANSLVKKGKKVAFLKMTDFVNRMRKLVVSDNELYEITVSSLKETDFLFLDDIGAEGVSSFSRDDLLFNILDYRMENNLTTIFTSNLDKESLLKEYQYDKNDRSSLMKAKRLLERIDILSDNFLFKGTNKRR